MRVEQTDEYRQWIDGLRDRAGRARILVRVDRLIHGNPGAHRNLTDGVSELKINVGPGYRVYYSQRGTVLLLLLAAGCWLLAAGCWLVATNRRSNQTLPRPLHWRVDSRSR